MAVIDNVLLKAKFRGAMLGSLLGDCLGSPFEGDTFSPGMKGTVQNCFEKLDGPYFKAPTRPYTDDSAMTKSVAQCLIDKPAVDYKHMAKLFTEEYFSQPKRGYGANVIEVFHKLRNDSYKDVFRPAREQFGGSGSFGNGGAMRITPIALFFYNNMDGMLLAATKSTEITHTNKLGVNGAILQCLAVQRSLLLDPSEQFNVNDFVSDLLEKIKVHEPHREKISDEDDPTPYQTQLKLMKQLLDIDDPNDPIKEEEVIGCLGNTLHALYSVPTAIYCFLKAHSGFPGIESDNVFRRAIQYAVTLGGDTDTIASMAGAIAGAYYGEGIINPSFIKHCENSQQTLELADNLFNSAVQASSSVKQSAL